MGVGQISISIELHIIKLGFSMEISWRPRNQQVRNLTRKLEADMYMPEDTSEHLENYI